VLYPVSVHFKGSGFYTTDYGRGSGAKKAAKDGGESSGSGETKKESSSGETKAAAAD
jgi:predicted nucleic acid-binding Zn ribbon protein